MTSTVVYYPSNQITMPLYHIGPLELTLVYAKPLKLLDANCIYVVRLAVSLREVVVPTRLFGRMTQ